MKVILDGKRVGKGYSGYYLKNRAYFTERGLTKRIILHELYHHLIDAKGSEMPIRREEKEANTYARGFLRKPQHD
jgi:hypothetical protein